QFFLGLAPDNTVSVSSQVDGVQIQGQWIPDLGQLKFTLPSDGGAEEYLGYYMEISPGGSPALAGIARMTYDDGSHGDSFGWYAAEDLPHIRLEPPYPTNPPLIPNGRWKIADGGSIGTLFIEVTLDGLFN